MTLCKKINPVNWTEPKNKDRKKAFCGRINKLLQEVFVIVRTYVKVSHLAKEKENNWIVDKFREKGADTKK